MFMVKGSSPRSTQSDEGATSKGARPSNMYCRTDQDGQMSGERSRGQDGMGSENKAREGEGGRSKGDPSASKLIRQAGPS